MRQRVHGGTRPKHTSKAIPIVSCYLNLRFIIVNLLSSIVAVDALAHTITHFCATGKFRQAADREKDIALIQVKELNNPKQACESYDRAADWYEQEDATS